MHVMKHLRQLWVMWQMNSRAKGKRYELELAKDLREYGYETRRTAQYCGNTGDASDVVGLPMIHIEAKHYSSTGFSYDWIEQAKRDTKNDDLPAVFHRINGKKTVVTMYLDDWMQIYREYEAGMDLKGRQDG